MRLRKVVALIASLLAFAVAGSAFAHGARGHARVGVYLGAPLYLPGPFYPSYGYYGPSPYYAYPPVVVPVPVTPPTYVERAPTQAPAPQAQYWYWCQDSNAYYPTVRECPGGWTPVAPQPSQAPQQ